MYHELTVKIGGGEYKVFFQNGFYTPSASASPVHKHNYAEIHLTAEDSLNFDVGGKRVSAAEGNLLLIPRNVLHCVVKKEGLTCHTAFQIDCDAKNFESAKIGKQTVLDFLKEIEKSKQTGDYTAIAAYIGLFCSHFKIAEPSRVSPIADQGFLIREFFSRHYNEELCLADLARELHLSERQTERLVLQYTGRTFRKEITAQRMEMAKHLAEHTDLPLTEIARYVGYQSYAGFWKAMKKSK